MSVMAAHLQDPSLQPAADVAVSDLPLAAPLEPQGEARELRGGIDGTAGPAEQTGHLALHLGEQARETSGGEAQQTLQPIDMTDLSLYLVAEDARLLAIYREALRVTYGVGTKLVSGGMTPCGIR